MHDRSALSLTRTCNDPLSVQVGDKPVPLYEWTAPHCLWRALFWPSAAVQEVG